MIKIKAKDKYMIEGNPVNLTQHTSHVNPQVMLRESANVAIAPPNTRKYMRKLRTGSGELYDFPTRFGKPYGKEAVLNKKIGKKAENSIRKQARKRLGSLRMVNKNEW